MLIILMVTIIIFQIILIIYKFANNLNGNNNNIPNWYL